MNFSYNNTINLIKKQSKIVEKITFISKKVKQYTNRVIKLNIKLFFLFNILNKIKNKNTINAIILIILKLNILL